MKLNSAWLRRASPLLAFIFLLLVVNSLLPAKVEAAWNPAGESGEAVYEVLPLEGRVRVTLSYRLTNLDEETRRTGAYYYAWSSSIHSSAQNIRVYDSSAPLVITSTEKGEYWITIRYTLNKLLYYGMSYSFTVEYDLPISKSIASFSAWGFTNTATIRVIVPRGYYDEVTLSRGGYSRQETATRITYTYFLATGGDSFYTLVDAIRKVAFGSLSSQVTLKDGRTIAITVTFWEGDEAEAKYILDLYRLALLRLEEMTGVAYPPRYPVVVTEGTAQDTRGGGGVNQGAQGIIILYYYVQEDDVLLHELAHYWATNPPFAETWMREGYADLYAYLLLNQMGMAGKAEDIRIYRTKEYEEGKARFTFPLSEWSYSGCQVITEAACPGVSFGYGKSFLFVLGLYQQIGLNAIQKTNQAVFAAGNTVDWFDYLEILETQIGQELGRLFVGWVVPDSFGTAFDLWQQTEKGYREAKTTLGTARDTLGIEAVEKALPGIKSSIVKGGFTEALSRVQSTQGLIREWQSALKAFRDAETTIGQPSDTLGMQTVSDSLASAKALLSQGQFSQSAAQVNSTLSLFTQWQSALKAFRAIEMEVNGAGDTLGIGSVKKELEGAQSSLTTGDFSGAQSRSEATRSLFSQWQSALKAFREAEATIGQPSDTLGMQTVSDSLASAKALLTQGQFPQSAVQVNSTLSLFAQWQTALKAFRGVLSISEMGHFLNRTLSPHQAALTSSLRPWL